MSSSSSGSMPIGKVVLVVSATKVCSSKLADMRGVYLRSQKFVNKKVEKIETISLICTFGVVSCGLAVIVAATVRVIRDIFKNAPQVTTIQTIPDDKPTWEVAVTKRRRRPQGPTTPTCEGCGEDVSKAQIVRSESHDDHTFLIKECPSCKREFSVDAK